MAVDNNLQNNANFFNHVYREPGSYYGDEVRPEFNFFIKSLSCRKFVVLDLGCGEGRYSLFLAKHVHSVDSVDFSSVAIEKLNSLAIKNGLNIIPSCADVNNAVLAKEKYDLIVMATLLDHLDHTGQNRLISKIYSSLMPGGMVYANVFTTKDPGYKIKDSTTVATKINVVSETAPAIRHYFKPLELKNSFSQYDVLEYKEFVEEDRSHGSVHIHGWASILAQKPCS